MLDSIPVLQFSNGSTLLRSSRLGLPQVKFGLKKKFKLCDSVRQPILVGTSEISWIENSRYERCLRIE